MTEGRAVAPAASAEHCFVLPALTGAISGGTLYNRELLAALRGLLEFHAFELNASGLGAAIRTASALWVDSLYLAAVPELKRQTPGRVALIVHYLPSFVALGRAASSSELGREEREALLAADAFLVTSAFMRDALEALVAPTRKPILVVEPGTHAQLAPASTELAPASTELDAELRVVMVGSVVPGKGIEPWLRALEARLGESDRLEVSIIGSLTADPEYAERCQRFVRESAALAPRIKFAGPLDPSETLLRLAAADLLVSASSMESYGMALAEARVTGVPILAKIGGNSGAHVDPAAGSELAPNELALARACVALARDPELRRARSALARAHAPPGRAWRSAAQEFAVQLAEWEK
jgi:glycosyltransferase involved in cell wall biosynthesis